MAETSREIERRFRPETLPDGIEGSPKKSIRQGYLAVTERGTEVRVRKQGKRYTLTIKEGGGETRSEAEVEIDAAQFATLWPLTKGKRVKKVRHEVSHDGVTFEVNVYRGKLKGLTIVEVEFPDEAVARAFRPPAWFGQEVTGDDTFSNQNLARHGLPQEAGR